MSTLDASKDAIALITTLHLRRPCLRLRFVKWKSLSKSSVNKYVQKVNADPTKPTTELV